MLRFLTLLVLFVFEKLSYFETKAIQKHQSVVEFMDTYMLCIKDDDTNEDKDNH